MRKLVIKTARGYGNFDAYEPNDPDDLPLFRHLTHDNIVIPSIYVDDLKMVAEIHNVEIVIKEK